MHPLKGSAEFRVHALVRLVSDDNKLGDISGGNHVDPHSQTSIRWWGVQPLNTLQHVHIKLFPLVLLVTY